MKTAESFLKLCLTEKQLDETSVYILRNCLKAMELYKNQQPEPRPIKELFEMDKDCYVWLLMSDEYENDITIGRFEKGGYLKCLGLVQCDKNDFTHFIPAQIPKF